MSDTPETDAKLHGIKAVCIDDYMLDTMADFARRLERERNEARKLASALHEDQTKLIMERDEACDKVTELEGVIRALRATMREEARK